MFISLLLTSHALALHFTQVDRFITEKKSQLRIITFCGQFSPCPQFEARYSQIQKELQDIAALEWVTLDSEDAMELLSRFEIEDVPHIIYFEPRSLTFQPYLSGFSVSEFVRFFKRMHEGVKVYTQPTDLQNDLKNDLYAEGCILGVFKNQSEKIKDFEEFAKTLPGIQFAISTEEAFLKEYGEGVFVYRPPILHTSIEYLKLDEADELESAPELFYSGLTFVTPFSVDYVYGEQPIAILYHHINVETNPEQLHYLATRYQKAAAFLESEIRVVIADGEFYQMVLVGLDLYNKEVVLVIEDFEDIYVLKQEDILVKNQFNTERVTKFLADYLVGEVQPYVKTEMEPLEPMEKGVHKLVGTNADDVLLSLNNDAILLVHSEYCPACPEVVEVIENLAGKYNGLKFFKIDGEKNFVPHRFGFEMYPAIFYISQEAEEPEMYEDDYSETKIKKFIDKRFSRKTEL